MKTAKIKNEQQYRSNTQTAGLMRVAPVLYYMINSDWISYANFQRYCVGGFLCNIHYVKSIFLQNNFFITWNIIFFPIPYKCSARYGGFGT